MDDDSAPDPNVLTAAGGVCAPSEPFYRPMRDALPLITVERGGISFIKPPEGGWPPYVAPKVTRRQRWARRLERRRKNLGTRLVVLGHRWEGTICDGDSWD